VVDIILKDAMQEARLSAIVLLIAIAIPVPLFMGGQTLEHQRSSVTFVV